MTRILGLKLPTGVQASLTQEGVWEFSTPEHIPSGTPSFRWKMIDCAGFNLFLYQEGYWHALVRVDSVEEAAYYAEGFRAGYVTSAKN